MGPRQISHHASQQMWHISMIQKYTVARSKLENSKYNSDDYITTIKAE